MFISRREQVIALRGGRGVCLPFLWKAVHTARDGKPRRSPLATRSTYMDVLSLWKHDPTFSKSPLRLMVNFLDGVISRRPLSALPGAARHHAFLALRSSFC